MFPGETEWGDGFGGTLFGTPSEKKGKRKKGRLELEPPDFDIPQFGGGGIRKRYPLQFKVNAVGHSQKRVKGAQGPGGRVGISYAGRVLGIPDKATLPLWVNKIDEMEAELSQAAQKGGTKGKKKAQKRMTLNTEIIRSNADAELEIVAWINDLRSDSISARVSTARIKHKALDLNPNVSGERPAPSDLAGSIRYRKRKTAWCMRFLKRYRYSVRAVTRQGQKLPAGWPETAMKAIKE